MSFMTLAKAYLKHFLLLLPATFFASVIICIGISIFKGEIDLHAIWVVLYTIYWFITPFILLFTIPCLVYLDDVKDSLNQKRIYLIALTSAVLIALPNSILAVFILPFAIVGALFAAMFYIKTATFIGKHLKPKINDH